MVLSLIPGLQEMSESHVPLLHSRQNYGEPQEGHQGGLGSQEQPDSFPSQPTLTSHWLSSFLALSYL